MALVRGVYSGPCAVAAHRETRRGMKLYSRVLIATLACGLYALSVLIVSPARADTRIALVVGNSDYKYVSPLSNPANDAKLIAKTLAGLGFKLVGNGRQLDLTKPQFDQAVQDFGNAIQGADVALFYYAGHGVQVRGANFLVPVSANPTREVDVDFQMLDVNLVLREMEYGRAKLNLVILDACRNNPFRMAPGNEESGSRGGTGNPVRMAPADGRSRGIGSRGLAAVEPSGAGAVLVAFAARDGTTADDGVDHSPFTQALLTHIETPGLDIGILFRRVRDSVLARTNNVQEPFVYGSLPGQEFYFKQAGQ
jgi:uncharacterized caspase-like protein